MKKCVKCGESYSGEEIAEWRLESENFSFSPFICPDCYDHFERMDPEEQLNELLN